LEEIYSLPEHVAGMDPDISGVASLSERMERLGVMKVIDARWRRSKNKNQSGR
jgi:hypothetical protein